MKSLSLLLVGFLALPASAQLRVEKNELKLAGGTVLSWQPPQLSGEGPAFAPPQLSLQQVTPNVFLASVDVERALARPQEALRVELQLPEFARGLSIYRLKRFWTSPVFTSDPRTLAGDSQMLLWQRAGDRRYHLLAPLVGEGMVASLGVREHRFGVQASSYMAGQVAQRVPLFVYATAHDPYEAMRSAYSAALPAENLRWNKPYPQALRKLGWCSWNAFYEKVDRDKILAAADWLRQEKVPARTLLIDDGWMTTQGRRLSGFAAHPEKFPGGLAALVAELKQRGFEHVGVWHTLQGYWDGVVPESEAGRGQQLFAGNEGLSIPDPRGTRFFHTWYARLKQAGIDFVKVDNQGGHYRFTDGLIPRASANAGAQKQLQEAVQAHFGNAAINCMEISLENVYQWNVSNVARSSDDYLPENPTNSAEHILHNAYTAAWLSNFAYPDYDMFESGARDGEFHAVARALSGGPVYCTDQPGKGNSGVLRQLCLEDGEVLRPDQPSRVPAELLLRDPSLEAVPLRLQGEVRRPGYLARLQGSFNVNKSGSVQGTDGEARQACWRRRLGQSFSGRRPLELERLGWELTTCVTPDRGLAVFGLLDKYVGAAAVRSVQWVQASCRVELAEGGRVGLWCAHPPKSITAQGKPLAYRRLGKHWIELQAPALFHVTM